MSASDKNPSTRYQNLSCGRSFGIREYSDVVLVVEDSDSSGHGARFNCHKVILAGASKTFSKLLCSEELKPCKDGKAILLVNNVDSKTLEKMLRHIYEEKLATNELDVKLLTAARNYKLATLVSTCLATIPNQFNSENISETLEIAYELNLEEIKAPAFKFVWDHFEEVLVLEAFKKLLGENTNLLSDILIESRRLTKSLEHPSAAGAFESQIVPLTTKDQNSTGDPVLVGKIENKAGEQTVLLPDNLPKEATGVRVIVVQILQAGTPNGGFGYTPLGFTKIWTKVNEREFRHFIFRTRHTAQMDFCQASELYFPIDPENRKIYADLSKAGGLHEGTHYQVHLYLVGYTA